MSNEKFSRDSAFQMPDELTVVAIGGCGKKLINHLTEHEWFMRHYLRGGKRLRILTMDTDSNQREDDVKRAEGVNALGAEILKTSGMGGSLKMQYLFLPDLANVERVSSLTGKQVIEQVKSRKAEPLVDVWWMHDPDNGIDYSDLKKIDRNITDDFGGGVHRRRAISKAIFYKAITQGGDTFPSFQGHGPIAIVVGLGGGTGSGMFIDLARYIKGLRGDETKIWLFAVLPAVGEGEKEQLNAAIALTEIEYLNLKEEKLFNYVILSSLSPTGYVDGGDRIKEVREFDEAFPYLLINSLYLPTADISAIADAKKEFSGLIFADSHIIEYPVEDLMALKTEYETVIEELTGISHNRRKYTESVDEALSSYSSGIPSLYVTAERGEVTREDITFLKKEVLRLQEVWENKIARDLNYQTPEEISSYIKNNYPEEITHLEKIETYDGLVEYITKLKNYMQGGGSRLENESDRRLFTYIGESLTVIEDLATVQMKILRIREQSLRTALLKIVRGEEDFAQSVSDLNARASALSVESAEMQKKNLQKKEELGALIKERDQIEEQVHEECNSLLEPVKGYLDKKASLDAVEEREGRVIGLFEEMRTKGGEEALKGKNKKAKLIKRKDWLKNVDLASVQEEIEKLESVSGEDLGYLRDLAEAVALYYYYTYLTTIAQKMGFVDKLLGHDLDKEMIRAEKEEKEDRIRRIADLKTGKISIRDPFEVVLNDSFITSDIGAILNKKADSILSPLIAEFNIDPVETPRLEAAFEEKDSSNVLKAIRSSLSEMIEEKKGISEKISGYQDENATSEKNIENTIKLTEFIRKCITLVDDTFEYRKAYNRHLQKMEEGLHKIGHSQERSTKTEEGLYMTRFGEINPNVLALIQDSSDMSVLDRDGDGKKEIEKLFKIVNWKYKDLIDTRKLGVNSFAISYGQGGTERWNFDKAALVVSSPSRWISDLVSNSHDDFRRQISGALDLDSNSSAKVNAHNYSRPWEISLTFFTAASFLDNISPLTTGGGYWEKYEKKQENILHHVLFLQKGKYILREKLLHLKEAAEIAEQEKGSEEEIRAARDNVFALYSVKDLKDTVRRGE